MEPVFVSVCEEQEVFCGKVLPGEFIGFAVDDGSITFRECDDNPDVSQEVPGWLGAEETVKGKGKDKEKIKADGEGWA